MSSNNIPFDKNVFTDSNIINNNNNKNSIKKSHNGTSSDQLIFFK